MYTMATVTATMVAMYTLVTSVATATLTHLHGMELAVLHPTTTHPSKITIKTHPSKSIHVPNIPNIPNVRVLLLPTTTTIVCLPTTIVPLPTPIVPLPTPSVLLCK